MGGAQHRRTDVGTPWAATRALALLVCACAAPPAPAPEPPARPASAPSPTDACPSDLSGLWRHGEDDSFRYLARDDGGVLTLQVTHTTDAGAQQSELVLVRAPGSFLGAVGLARMLPDGGCAALFPAEIVSCADGGLVVSTVERLRVDGAWRPVEPGVYHLHRLVRVTADAG